jgi:hypothetical protein
MVKEYYIIVDEQNNEVNFFDRAFPNARNLAVLSARGVPDSMVLHRKIDTETKNKVDIPIWPDDG